MKGKRIIAVVVAVSLTGGAIYGGITGYQYYQSKNLVAEVQPVSNLNMGYWGDQETSYGMVTNDSSQEIYLDNDSKVQEVFVQAGDEVQTGDPLIQYDTSQVEIDIKRKKLDINTIENNIAKAERALKVLKETKPVEKKSSSSKSSTSSTTKTKKTTTTSSALPQVDPNDSRIYNYLTSSSVPFNSESADGTKNNPYIYYVNKGAYAYGSFFNSIRPTAKGKKGKYVVFMICKKDASGQMMMEEVTDSETESTETTETTETMETTEATETTEQNSISTMIPMLDDSVSPNTITYNGNALPTEYDEDRAWYVFSGEEVVIRSDYQDLLDQIESEDDSDDSDSDDSTSTDGYTKDELDEAIYTKEQEIKKLDIDRRKEELNLETLENTASDGMVYAKIDGVVKSVKDISNTSSSDDDNSNSSRNDSAFMVITGSEGLYVSGTISELLLDEIKPGMVVTANSWETGNTFEATITEISDYPVSGSSFGDGNPNVSYYQYTAYIEDSSALKNGEYVDLTIQTNTSDTSANSIYIEKAYVRDENGRSYVMIADENNRLKKQYVTTGKTVYGSSIEITSGLLETDLIAFPYGKTAVEGTAVSQDSSDSIDYMY